MENSGAFEDCLEAIYRQKGLAGKCEMVQLMHMSFYKMGDPIGSPISVTESAPLETSFLQSILKSLTVQNIFLTF